MISKISLLSLIRVFAQGAVYRFLVRIFCIVGLVCISSVTPSYGQILEPNAISVPVRIDGVMVAGIWTDPDDESNTMDGWADIGMENSSGIYQSGSGSFSAPGWVASPGKSYIFDLSFNAVESMLLQFSVPAGYRCYIDDVLTTRWSWVPDDGEPSLSLRFERDEAMQFGEPTSLRPGRLFWAVGLGRLVNGRAAGFLSLRGLDFSNVMYTPAALDFASGSPEVMVFRNSTTNCIEQIVVPSGVVVVLPKSGTTTEYYVRFYDIHSPALTMSGPPSYRYTVNDPGTNQFLCEYQIGNPNPAATPSGSLRIIKTIPNGTDPHISSTTMNRGSGTAAGVYAWHDSAIPAGVPPTTAAYESYSVSGNTGTTSIGSFWQETRSYSGGVWGGGVLLNQTLAGVTTAFGYTNNNLTTAATTNGSWVKYDYYSDWDRAGQVLRQYKPFGEQATETTSGEVTHYTYVADWTGRLRLPSLIETRVGGVSGTVIRKSEFIHDYTSVTKKWQDRWSLPPDIPSPPPYPEYQLAETVKKDYFGQGASDYLTTTYLNFHEQVMASGKRPQHRYFEGLPYAEIQCDGSMVVFCYIRGDYAGPSGDNPSGIFTPSVTGTGMLCVRITGRSGAPSSGPNTTIPYPTFTYGTAQQNTHGSFCLVKGKSIAVGTITANDGLVREKLEYVCTSAGILQLVNKDVNVYGPGGVLNSTTRINTPSGTWKLVENVWELGRLKSSTNDKGVKTDYYYYGNGRIWKTVVSGASSTIEGVDCSAPAITTVYTYNDAGMVTKQEVVGSGETLVSSWTYDTGGRVTSEVTPSTNGSTTVYPTPLQVQNTLPGGGVKLTTYFPDGRLKSVSGTGVVAESYTYQVLTNGNLQVRKTIGPTGGSDIFAKTRYQEKTFDWIGRPVFSSRPGFLGQVSVDENFVYNAPTDNAVQNWSLGHLKQITRTTGANIIIACNLSGEEEPRDRIIDQRFALDVDGGGISQSGKDRLSDQTENFETDADGVVWNIKKQWSYITEDSSNPTLVSSKKSRITHLYSTAQPGLRAETRSYDIFPNETIEKVFIYPSASRKMTETSFPGKSSGVRPVQYGNELCGVPVLTKDQNGRITSASYDTLGRKVSDTDPRTGTTTYAYHTGKVWLKTATDAAGKLLFERAYDGAGRVVLSKDGLGFTIRTGYSTRGEVCYVWGSGTYPVSYVYNDYGDKVKMRTYQDPYGYFGADSADWPYSGDLSVYANETIWDIDVSSGLLKKKTDALGHYVEYTYNRRGQLRQRIAARNVPGTTTRLTTTYDYYGDTDSSLPAAVQSRATGDLYQISYNDNNITPWVSHTYDRRGATLTTTDIAGTHTYTRCICGKLQSETLGSLLFANQCIEHELETNAANGPLGRVIGYQFGVTGSPAIYQDLNYLYSDSGRLVTIQQQGASDKFQYAYVANSGLIDTLSHVKTDNTVDWRMDNDYEPNRDLLTSTTGAWNGTTHTRFEYTYDDRRHRSTVVQRKGLAYADLDDDIHRVFAYNGRGELTQAYDYQGGTASDRSAPMSGRLYDYNYDGIGNRRSSNTSGVPELRDEYRVNALNQYVSRENNTMSIGGLADPEAKVVVGADSRTRAGRTTGRRHWGDTILVNNANDVFYGDVTIYAVKPGTAQQDWLRTITAKGTLAPAWQTFNHDEDGNLVTDGVWTYEWDAENRLRAMQTNKAGTTAGLPMRIVFTYDSLHRRVQKRIYNKVNSAWVEDTAKERRFAYNGWNLVGEFSVTYGTTTTLVLTRSYVWGLDILRSLKGSGGVAALLQITDHETNPDGVYYPSFDGNGNVASLVNASSGAVAAAYEYSPYGELLRCEGEFAYKNPFRFSTKYMDDETGLLYYGTRYYDPRNGRFINRDTIEESGGINLYGFVLNNPVNKWDMLGMCGRDGEPPCEMAPFVVSESRGKEYLYITENEGGSARSSGAGGGIRGCDGDCDGGGSDGSTGGEGRKADPLEIDHCRALAAAIEAKVSQLRTTAIQLSVTAAQYSSVMGLRISSGSVYSDLRHSVLDKIVSLLPEGSAKQVISSGWAVYDGNKDISDPSYGPAGGAVIAAGKGGITIAELLRLVPRVGSRVWFWGGVAIDGINAYGFVAGQVADGQVISQYQDSLLRLNQELFTGKMQLSNDLAQYKQADCDNVLKTFGT